MHLDGATSLQCNTLHALVCPRGLHQPTYPTLPSRCYIVNQQQVLIDCTVDQNGLASHREREKQTIDHHIQVKQTITVLLLCTTWLLTNHSILANRNTIYW